MSDRPDRRPLLPIPPQAQRSLIPDDSLDRNPGSADELRIVSLDSDAEEAIQTLWSSFILIAAAVPPQARDGAEPLPADIVGMCHGETRKLALRLPGLASHLVRRLAGEGGNGRRARRKLRALSQRVWREAEPLSKRLESRDWKESSDETTGRAAAALSDLEAALRERALEELDTEVLLLAGKTGATLEVALRRVRPVQGEILLLERLYQRVETSLIGGELLAVERHASRWWFSRWALPGPGMELEFGPRVREQEMSLVERPCVGLGVPVLTALLEQGLVDICATPPRQRRLAEALSRSTIGAFVVRERTADASVLEDPHTGRRYRIREHNRELEYESGHLALGRLIPLEDGTFVRSPGMAFLGGGKGMEELARDVATRLAEADGGLTAAIVLEGAISILSSEVGGRDPKRKRPSIPRRVRPAASRSAARETLEAAMLTLEEHDAIDEVLADWLAALQRQAGGSGSRRGRRPALAKRKRKKRR